ncbi:hypothetical protein BGW37DRAFT_555242 [Umbelopsis sp. PMI_123]|nr:hypothetical protein BGW37DRAFT_555242 [Umbelopsis sp. PMI_123]
MLTTNEINPYCFTQSYFYSLTQIVRDEKVTGTNSKLPLNQLNQAWENLKAAHPTITRLWVSKPKSSSTAVSEACVTLARNYSSSIVENFQGRVTSYLRYKISTVFQRCQKKRDTMSSTIATVDHLCPELKEQNCTKEKTETGLAEIEENLPTAKTASIQQYYEYIGYALEYMEAIFSFYSFNRGEMKFRNHQGKQRAREEMACIFLDGGKKYNAKKRKRTRKNRRRRNRRRAEKQAERQAAIPAPSLSTGPRESAVRRSLNIQGPGPQHWRPAAYEESAKAPFIVFSDAMIGRKSLVHIPSKQTGVVGVLWKALKRNEREENSWLFP